MQKKILKLVPVALAFLISACGLLPNAGDDTKNWTADKLYSEAHNELTNGGYDQSVKLFEKLESRYPFGVYAQQAQMEIAYAYYRQEDKEQALAAVERFIKLHPNHPNLDYIFYLRGLINFNDRVGFLDAIVHQDPTERDPKAAREAFDAFKLLSERFPNSVYTKDAILRMKYLVNMLAQYEVNVANYYYRRGAYLAAANRAQTAVKDYNGAPAAEEALYVMARSYGKLGLSDLGSDAERVLKLNYPNSPFINGPRVKETSWWKIW